MISAKSAKVFNGNLGKKRFVDVIDDFIEENTKEGEAREMVFNKLLMLVDLIRDYHGDTQSGTKEYVKNADDLNFVETIYNDLYHEPGHRITEIEIRACNELWRKYNEKH